jgi:hypothetical protein
MEVRREYILRVQGGWQVQVLTPLCQDKQGQVEVVPDVVMVEVGVVHQTPQKERRVEMEEYPEEEVEEVVVGHL